MTFCALRLELAIDGLTQHVEHAAQRLTPYWDADRLTGVAHDEAAPQAGGGAHRDGTHGVWVKVLLDLDSEMLLWLSFDYQGVMDTG
jgi:hypothetical protein